MSTVKGGRKPLIRKNKSALCISAKPAAIPLAELLQFLELSIGGKADDYLLQLALRDTRMNRVAETSEKLLAHLERQGQTAQSPMALETKSNVPETPLITGIVTMAKSVLSSVYYRVGVKFTVVIDAISHTQRAPTPLMKHLSIPRLSPNTMLLRSTSFEENIALVLNFSDIELAFKISPSVLNPLQQFDAKVLFVGSKKIDLCLTEKLPASQPGISSFRN